MNRLLPLAGLLAVSVSSLAAQTYDYYLFSNPGGTTTRWNTVNHYAAWRTSTGAFTTSDSIFTPTSTHYNNGYTIFTNDGSTPNSFQGGTLVLGPRTVDIVGQGSSTAADNKLELRAWIAGDNTTYLSSVTNLVIASGGSSIGTNDTTVNTNGAGLNVTNLTVNGNLVLEPNNSRQVRVNITNLAGSANIQAGTGSGSRVAIGIQNGTSFTGDIIINAPSVRFTSNISTSGGLFIEANRSIFTDNLTLTFSSVSFGTLPALEIGTYSIAALDTHAQYGNFFAPGSTGTLNVIPEPAAAAALVGAFALGCATLRRRRVRA